MYVDLASLARVAIGSELLTRPAAVADTSRYGTPRFIEEESKFVVT